MTRKPPDVLNIDFKARGICLESPKGFRWLEVDRTSDGLPPLRAAVAVPLAEDANAIPKADVLILTGFQECIEKTFDTIVFLQSLGTSVWIMDWRGQGGSSRYLAGDKYQRSCSRGVAADLADLDAFFQQHIHPARAEHLQTHGQNRPLIALAHSMGGHHFLHYALLKNLPDPNGIEPLFAPLFDGVILSASMLELVLPMPLSVCRLVVGTVMKMGLADSYIPPLGDWSLQPKARELLSLDPVRSAVQDYLFYTQPSLRQGWVTFGWMHHAMEGLDFLKARQADLARLDLPVLLLTPRQDTIVKPSGQDWLARVLPNCHQINFPEARHEILMERAELRNKALEAIGDFIEGILLKR